MAVDFLLKSGADFLKTINRPAEINYDFKNRIKKQKTYLF